MVGRDADVSAGLELRGEDLEEDAVQEPPLLLALLGPGVGEVDVDGAHGGGRQRRLDEAPAIGADDPGVGQPGPGEPVAADAEVGQRKLDAQEIVGRLAAGRFDQEPGLAAADLDLERGLPSKLPGGVEGARIPDLLVGACGPAAAGRRPLPFHGFRAARHDWSLRTPRGAVRRLA